MDGILRAVSTPDWIFVVFIVVALSMAVARWIFAKNFAFLGNLPRFMEQKDNAYALSLFIHIAFSLLAASILFYFFNAQQFDYLFSPIQVFVIFFLLLFIYLSVRTIVGGYIHSIIQPNQEFQDIIKRKTFFMIWFILFLLLILLLLFYSGISSKYLLFITLGLLFIQLVMEIPTKSRKDVTEGGMSWYYFILYLCALEILPFLFLLKYGFGWDVIT